MGRQLATLLILTLALGGCGQIRDSRVNPFNWFGGAQQAAPTLTPSGGYAVAAQDPRPLVAEVTGLRVQPVQGGALITATGLPPTQGWWGAELLAEPLPQAEGLLAAPQELRFRFVLAPPFTPQDVSIPQSREVSVGLFLSHQALRGISRITVTGASNGLSVSR